jgi:RND family efflux transporter MFP subunit
MNVKVNYAQATGMVVAALLLGTTACARGSASAELADSGVTIGPENVAVVATRQIQTGPQISGSLQADEQAVVRAEVAGAVLQTYVEAGQRVQKGDLLARLDDTALRDQMLFAKSAVATAQDASDIAQRNLERSEALIKVGAIADRDLETARNGAMSARTQLENAKAVYANAQKNLDKTEVRAPFSGVVSERSVAGGDYVRPGDAVASVVNPATMRLVASVPAHAVTELKLGMPVNFEVTGYPERSFTGHISRVDPTADPTTRQVGILVRIPNAGNSLVAGLFAQGRVATQTRTSPVVPASAVDQHGIRPSVMALRQGRVTRVDVELGITDQVAETVEILKGLVPGDTILVGAARGLSANTPVKVSPLATDQRS